MTDVLPLPEDPEELDAALAGRHPGLSLRQQLYVREYLKDFNGSRAAKAAGYPLASRQQSTRSPRVGEAIKNAMELLLAKHATGVKPGEVIERLIAIAMADPNDIVQHRRGACRYCYGLDSAYQYKTQREFDEALALFNKTDMALVADMPNGGLGYDPRLAPVESCPECHGQGVPSVYVEDTRLLSPAARALYAGVKTTKDGAEIKMHDQVKNLELLARHLGLLKDSIDVNVKSDLAERLLNGRKRAGQT
jgi:phage terminase small subunit